VRTDRLPLAPGLPQITEALFTVAMDKPEWFYRQSGVIPYRWQQGELQVLLITNRRNRRWVIPKGIVEPGLSPAASAVKEAWEEAGLRGRLHPQAAGSFSYAKWGGECRVEVFLFQVQEQAEAWPEAVIRRREWLSVAAAATRVREAQLRLLLESLPGLLQPAGRAVCGGEEGLNHETADPGPPRQIELE